MYVLWKICECERTRDWRLLLSDVSPQDCDQGQVSWWPGGQDQDPGNERPSPTSGDCLVTAVDTSLSPLPLRCCWIRNLRSSELRLALGASSQHWTNTHLDIQIYPCNFKCCCPLAFLKCSKIHWNNSQFSYVHLSHLQNIYISLRVGFCLSNLEPRHVFKVLKLLYESTWQRPPLWAVSGDYGE